MDNTQHNIKGDSGAPEFSPIQQRGPHPIFGVSRSTFYNLERAGLIRLVRLRKAGQVRGRVLIDCASVRKYLEKLCAEQVGVMEKEAVHA